MLTIGRTERLVCSRYAGAYFGLRPRRYQSGESIPQLGISKEGDGFMRRLLVQAAQHILGLFGRDTDLRRWGGSLVAGGGRGATSRAVVAVARKLSALLHRLWVTGETYDPLRNSQNKQRIQQLGPVIIKRLRGANRRSRIRVTAGLRPVHREEMFVSVDRCQG